jgi:NADH pyrophosphatase NudC (nudix superfamily)
MVWKPHVTVAAIVEKKQRFLLVEETTENGVMFNQPAGHLEPGESLTSAIQREVREETAWRFTPEAIVAVQLWRRSPEHPSFLRFCFTGPVSDHNPDQTLDDEIVAAHWLTRQELVARQSQWRSPLVMTSVDQYLSGQRFPLSLLHTYLDTA